MNTGQQNPGSGQSATPTTQETARAIDEAAVTARVVKETLDPIRAALVAAGVEETRTEDVAAAIRQLGTEAADGRRYREDLVTDALEEGVRAFGNEFKRDEREAMLRKMDTPTLERTLEDWAKLGNTRFPAGRQTGEDSEKPTVVARRAHSAYDV